MEILAVKLAVRVIEYHPMADFQQLASRFKLAAAHGGELFVGAGMAAVGGRLAGSEANYVGFHATFRVAQQGTAKTARLIVRMGGKTEQAKHLFSLYPSLILCITRLPDRARRGAQQPG